MYAQLELFPKLKVKRPKPVKRAHSSDVGDGWNGFKNCATFACNRCGWESGWELLSTDAEVRRGIPCLKCNRTESDDDVP